MIKHCTPNFDTENIPVFLQIRVAIQFLVIHFSFPKDSTNKHLQLCKQNAFSNSFIKQSVPSQEIKRVITNTSKSCIKQSSLQMPVRGHTLGYTRQKFSCDTLIFVLHLQQLSPQGWFKFLRTKYKLCVRQILEDNWQDQVLQHTHFIQVVCFRKLCFALSRQVKVKNEKKKVKSKTVP